MPALVLNLLLVALLLAVTGLLQAAARALLLPYTVLLAVFGIVLGALAAVTSGLEGLPLMMPLADGLAGFDLTADGILYLFLPILLFQAGLTIDVRRLLDDIAPVLALAILAVVICTGAVGLALWGLTDVGLVACLLLGAIIATTDPVAVLGIFRDVGAPTRLSILVEGESLFNDAAAIALFTVFVGVIAMGQDLALGEATARFLIGFLGGCAVGYAGAQAIALLLRLVRNLPLAETTVTVALAYLVFIAAEQMLHVSGVVAVVVAALAISARGRTLLPPDSWETLNHVWAQIGFWASSLIFVFASMLVPRFLDQVTPRDGILLLVLIGAAFVARAIVLYGVLPLLSRAGLGERVNHRYRLVILWGGVRGAVTLALALAVVEDPRVPPDIQHFVALLATGFVLFTLLVNATTLRPVMRGLGLNRLSPVDRVVRDQAIALALGTVVDQVEHFGRSHGIGPGTLEQVVCRYRARRDEAYAALEQGPRLSDDQQLLAGLIALTSREEELYLEHFSRQSVSRRSVNGLLAKAGRLRDAAWARGQVGYRRASADSLQFRTTFQLATVLHRRVRVHRPLADTLAVRYESLLITRMVLMTLRHHFLPTTLAPFLGDAPRHQLDGVLEYRLDSCTLALEDLRLQYPDYAHSLEERLTGRVALRMEQREYLRLYQEGVINHEIYHDLEVWLAQRWSQEGKPPGLDLGLDTRALVDRFPMFQDLSAADRTDLGSLLKPRLALPGERLMTVGERGDHMCFISTGVVEVRRSDQAFHLGTGDFVGEMALLTNLKRSADVVALTYCRLLVLQGRDFRRFLRDHPEIRAKIRAIAEERRAAGAAPVPAPDASVVP